MGDEKERVVTSRAVEDKRRDVEMLLLDAIHVCVMRNSPDAACLGALADALDAVQAPLVARMGVSRGQ